MTDFTGWRVEWFSLEWSFPRCGHGLLKTLDSGLRRNDEGLESGNLPGMAKGLSGWQPACSLLVVIPAQAGIQEGGVAVVNG